MKEASDLIGRAGGEEAGPKRLHPGVDQVLVVAPARTHQPEHCQVLREVRDAARRQRLVDDAYAEGEHRLQGPRDREREDRDAIDFRPRQRVDALHQASLALTMSIASGAMPAASR